LLNYVRCIITRSLDSTPILSSIFFKYLGLLLIKKISVITMLGLTVVNINISRNAAMNVVLW